MVTYGLLPIIIMEQNDTPQKLKKKKKQCNIFPFKFMDLRLRAPCTDVWEIHSHAPMYLRGIWRLG